MGSKKEEQATSEQMNSAIKVFLATALVALPLGYIVGNASASTDDSAEPSSVAEKSDHDDSDGHHDGGDDESHGHEMMDVAAADAPQIESLEVTKDPKSGWNLHMHTANFTFAPESASTPHVTGEGHAHMYIDGKKITRLYSGDYHLGELSEGEHTVKVTLNTNDHKDYAVDGVVVSASATVTDTHHDDGTDADDHGH